MTKEVLTIIKNAMVELGLEYGFCEYSGNPVVYPYFVGEYTETEPFTEDGLQESAFLLTGFSRGSWLALEDAKERIKDYFDPVSGKTVITESGSGVAVFYANGLPVPTADAELKRIQINLTIKEWRVN